MLCVSQWLVWLVSVIIFRFRQKGIKLFGGGIILKLANLGGCVEFRKPAPELCQRRVVEVFDGLL